jgi:hypothetical protein
MLSDFKNHLGGDFSANWISLPYFCKSAPVLSISSVGICLSRRPPKIVYVNS